MTKEAIYLMIISTSLFSFFLIAIIGFWLFHYLSESKINRLKKQLEEQFSAYFETGNEDKRSKIQRLNKTVGSRAKTKEIFIAIIIGKGDDFIERNHEILMNLYEVTGIKLFLLKRLQSKNVYKQSLACMHLGDLQISNTEASIIERISSDNNDVVYNVLLALAKFGDLKGLVHIFTNQSQNVNLSHRAIMEIITVFKGSKEALFRQTIENCDDYIKGVLIKAIAPYKMEALSEYYTKFLDSNHKDLKIASIRALCELNRQQDEPLIIAKLDDRDWEVRAAAAKGLEKLGTSNCLADVGKTTSDRVWWVRHNAASTLMLIPGGMEYASNILNGADSFARDAIAGVMEIKSS